MTATLDFSSVRPDDLTFSEVKTNKMGGQTVYIRYKGDNVNFEIPKGRLPFGLSSQKFDDNSTVKMTIDQSLGNAEAQSELGEWHRWLVGFDEFMIGLAHAKSESWFKKSLGKEVLQEFYRSCVTKSKKGYDPTFKMKIPVKGEQANIDIYNTREELVGQELIEKGCHVKTIVGLQSVWFVNKTFGVTWTVLQLQVFPLQKFNGFAFKRPSIQQKQPPPESDNEPLSPCVGEYEPFVPSDGSDNE